jgi:hypothetical protein
MPVMYIFRVLQDVMLLKSWDEKLDHFISTLPVSEDKAQHYKALGVSIFVDLKAIASYEWNSKKTVKCQTTLLRPSAAALKAQEDYGLSEVGISFMLYSKQGTHSGV